MIGLLVLSGIILYLAAAIALIQRGFNRDRERFFSLIPTVSRASAPSVSSPNAPSEARRRTPVDAAGWSCAASIGLMVLLHCWKRTREGRAVVLPRGLMRAARFRLGRQGAGGCGAPERHIRRRPLGWKTCPSCTTPARCAAEQWCSQQDVEDIFLLDLPHRPGVELPRLRRTGSAPSPVGRP